MQDNNHQLIFNNETRFLLVINRSKNSDHKNNLQIRTFKTKPEAEAAEMDYHMYRTKILEFPPGPLSKELRKEIWGN